MEQEFSYNKLFSKIESLVKEVNRSKDQPIPVKIRYKSSAFDLEKNKPLIVIFGEQHPGPTVNEVNFAKTNRALLNTLIALCSEKEIPVKSFIKEGCSSLEAYEKLRQKTIEELLVLGLSPLQVYINKIDPKMEVKVVESTEIFLEFALLSLLYSSRPGNARFSELEMDRIKYIISEDIDYDKYMLVKARVLKIEEELKLFEIFEEKYIKKIRLENDFGELALLALRSNIEDLVTEETLQQFDLRITKALLECGKDRDAYSAKLAAKLEPGVYPMFFGDYHIDNLIKAFEELEVGLIVLSPFA